LDLTWSTSLAFLWYYARKALSDGCRCRCGSGSRNSGLFVLLCCRRLGQPGLLTGSFTGITLVFAIAIFIITGFEFEFIVNLIALWPSKFFSPFVIPFSKKRLSAGNSKDEGTQSFLLTS